MGCPLESFLLGEKEAWQRKWLSLRRFPCNAATSDFPLRENGECPLWWQRRRWVSQRTAGVSVLERSSVVDDRSNQY